MKKQKHHGRNRQTGKRQVPRWMILTAAVCLILAGTACGNKQEVNVYRKEKTAAADRDTAPLKADPTTAKTAETAEPEMTEPEQTAPEPTAAVTVPAETTAPQPTATDAPKKSTEEIDREHLAYLEDTFGVFRFDPFEPKAHHYGYGLGFGTGHGLLSFEPIQYDEQTRLYIALQVENVPPKTAVDPLDQTIANIYHNYKRLNLWLAKDGGEEGLERVDMIQLFFQMDTYMCDIRVVLQQIDGEYWLFAEEAKRVIDPFQNVFASMKITDDGFLDARIFETFSGGLVGVSQYDLANYDTEFGHYVSASVSRPYWDYTSRDWGAELAEYYAELFAGHPLDIVKISDHSPYIQITPRGEARPLASLRYRNTRTFNNGNHTDVREEIIFNDATYGYGK